MKCDSIQNMYVWMAVYLSDADLLTHTLLMLAHTLRYTCWRGRVYLSDADLLAHALRMLAHTLRMLAWTQNLMSGPTAI